MQAPAKDFLTQIFYQTLMNRPGERIVPDLLASSCLRVPLAEPTVAYPVAEPRRGDVILARVQEVNPSYPWLETPWGEERVLRGGEAIVGVLGARRALRGFSGKLPARLEAGMRLDLLNKGGIIGECTAFHRDLGWPTRLEYLGTLHRLGQPLNLTGGALPLVEEPLPRIPVVMVLGTCMNAGKTKVCKQIIRLFSEKGFAINAGKIAGVACLQDTLAMRDAGAREALSFLDFGLPSTTEVDTLVPVARSMVHHLAASQPDFIVLEMGDGILGGYHVSSLFQDAEFLNASLWMVLCANDLVGAWGGVEWMAKHGLNPQSGHRVMISGPVTDSQEGIRYVEESWGIPAANAFDSAGKLCSLILEALMPWLESE